MTSFEPTTVVSDVSIANADRLNQLLTQYSQIMQKQEVRDSVSGIGMIQAFGETLRDLQNPEQLRRADEWSVAWLIKGSELLKAANKEAQKLNGSPLAIYPRRDLPHPKELSVDKPTCVHADKEKAREIINKAHDFWEKPLTDKDAKPMIKRAVNELQANPSLAPVMRQIEAEAKAISAKLARTIDLS